MKNYAIIDILNFIINQLAEVPGVAQATHRITPDVYPRLVLNCDFNYFSR